MKGNKRRSPFISFFESDLFNGLRPIQIKKVTAQVELRNGPADLTLRAARSAASRTMATSPLRLHPLERPSRPLRGASGRGGRELLKNRPPRFSSERQREPDLAPSILNNINHEFAQGNTGLKPWPTAGGLAGSPIGHRRRNPGFPSTRTGVRRTQSHRA
jgi:hypothetical protein